MAVLTIGTGSSAKDLPTPSEMSITLQDIDASTTTRNAKGYMLRDRVRGGDKAVRKLECKWAGLTLEDASWLMKAVEPIFFTLRYPDLYTGDMNTGTFYVGDRKSQVYRVNEDGENCILSSVSIDFIEK